MRDDVAPGSGRDIAVIGYAARFPGATNVVQFWDNLSRGVESIRQFTVEELASIGVSAALLNDPDYVRAGPPLTHLDAFDAGFFGISPREAAIMDPQQRFFLETAWEALEHAGHAPGTFKGSTGLFAGSGPNSYLIYHLLSDAELVRKEGIFLLRHTGNDKDVLATRASYQMNLRGPSVNIQTACSTSLVAVHVACQTLLQHGCDMALAGAVSIELPHAVGYAYRQNEIQSHDGHCRPFDAKSTGTVFGSGIGIVVLRRLQDALDAGDTIHAVIKGSAVNNDGGRKIGFLAPSAAGQVEVITEALGAAQIDPGTVDYIETHGTGTPIGDPIELSALAQAYGDRRHELKIGSVKSNIGHLDTAAGMAGLLKAILALEHRQIPATLHFKQLNPLIDAKANLRVVDHLTPWETDGHPRRAGVTSLGIGGTNAHVILEEAPAPRPSEKRRPTQLFTLSAKTPAALDDAARALAGHLRNAAPEDLADISLTLQAGRTAFAHRRMFVARDQAEAVALATQSAGPTVATGKTSDSLSIAFLFSGQGSQYCRMAEELYRTEPVFRRWLDDCADIATPHLGHDFRAILFPPDADLAAAQEQMRLTWNAQPILFSVEYALAQLWISWGIVPDRLLGHSLGEYPAACLSGVFSLEDAFAIVCARGNLMKKLAPGAMLAVALPENKIAPRLSDGINLAAVNSAEQCVVSGPVDSIDALHDQLRRDGAVTHRLESALAFHSGAVEPILAAFEEIVRSKQLHAPQIPLVSNVTGRFLTDTEATDPRYWARHMRETVRFADGLAALREEAGALFVEIGPGETLTTLGRSSAPKQDLQRAFPSLPRAFEASGDHATLLAALGRLWIHGVAVDWDAFHEYEQLRRVPLPTYPFQRKNFWMGPKMGTNWLADSAEAVGEWFYREHWTAAPLPPVSTSPGPWLVLGDASSDFSKLVDNLRANNGTVISVVAGERYEARGDGSFVVNLAEESSFSALVRELAERRSLPRHLVHLWGLQSASQNEERCFHSVVALLQAFGTHAPEQTVSLTAFSQRSIALESENVLHPDGSLLAGPCRVAPLEYPLLRARQIDVDAMDSAALAEVIRREVEIPNWADGALVVYRDGRRWTQTIEPTRPETAPSALRGRATYLITGGLGGLGFTVADWLARTQASRLVLLSRTAAPSDEQQRQFEEWRRLGADVLVVAGDVTDRASLDRALATVREKFGPLHGVFHAAGKLDDGLIALKKKEAATSVLAPKVRGLENLDAALRDVPLDFFALFSSISAVVPPAGQVDYCAANAFLEAYARSRESERRFLVLGWGPWSQVGMIAPKPGAAGQALPFRHPLLERVELDDGARAIYSGTLSVERHWVLADHRFHGGDSLLPGTANLEIAVSALWERLGRQPVLLENVVFVAPLRVATGRPTDVHAELLGKGASFQFSVTANERLFASGQARPLAGRAPTLNLGAIEARCPEKKIAPANTRQRGHFDFGPRWQSLRAISFGKDECLGTVELPEEFRNEADEFALHPALFDIATGVAMYLIPGYERAGDLLLPFAYQRLAIYGRLPARVMSHARLRHKADSDLIVFDLTVATESGEVIAEIEEFTVKRLRSVADVAQIEATEIRDSSASTKARSRGIATAEGIAALDRLLKSPAPNVVYISPIPLVPVATKVAEESIATSGVASTDDVEKVLMELWQALLGLEQVDASTDFFDAGGHSLLAVRLFTEIRKRFEVNFGLSTLFEARTVGALAELIRRSRTDEPAARNSTSTIVPIRGGDDTKAAPLFLIHDVGGSVLRYEHLARHFPTHQPIFAVESRGLSGLPVDYSVKEMARHYVAQIRERQPDGPYYLAGHSFGGLVTYEIARLLAAQGAMLGLVGLIDTFQRPITREDAEGEAAPMRSDRLPIFQRLAKDFQAQLMSRDRIGYLMERKSAVQAWLTKTSYRAAYRWSQKFGTKMPQRLRDAKEANWIAADYYQPEPYDGSIVLFRCLNRLDTDPPDSSHVWRRLAKGGVTILEVPGDHNSMLREPGVSRLAEQILNYLPSSATTSPLVTS